MIRLCAFADEADGKLEGQIAAMRRNGISLLEARNINGKNVQDLTLDEAKAYCKLLKENGIRVWSIGSPLGKVDIDVDFAEYAKKVAHVCEIARAFETDKIRMFSFFNAFEKKQEVFARLQKMVDIARSYNVELYHENEKGVYGDTLARVMEIMENVDGLKYIYDPANFIQERQSADETLAALHAKTDYFHIKDVIEKTQELVPAGYGDGKIAELVARITGDKVLTIEPHLAVFDGYAAIDDREMKNKFHFRSNVEAFDAAVNALKDILKKNGYEETEGGYVK